MISYSGYILYEIRHVYSPCLIPTSDVIYMRKYDIPPHQIVANQSMSYKGVFEVRNLLLRRKLSIGILLVRFFCLYLYLGNFLFKSFKLIIFLFA